MSKLKVKSSLAYIPPKPVLLSEAISKVMSTECVGSDVRDIVEELASAHPYFRYCQSKDFSDSQLLERQEEVIGALGAAVKTAFGGIMKTTSRVANSDAGLPPFAKWLGMGVTWGGLATWLAWDLGIRWVSEDLMKNFGIDVRGLSDAEGLDTKRAAIPPDATFKLKDNVWQLDKQRTHINAQEMAWQFDDMTTHIAVLTKLANRLLEAVDGKVGLDEWLKPMKPDSNGVITVKPLHKNTGFIIYKNGNKYFMEKVIANTKLAATSVIPTTKDLMFLQKAAQRMNVAIKKLDSTMIPKLKKLSERDKPAASDDGAFAAKVMFEMGNGTILLARSMLQNGRYFLNDSIATIMSYRAKE